MAHVARDEGDAIRRDEGTGVIVAGDQCHALQDFYVFVMCFVPMEGGGFCAAWRHAYRCPWGRAWWVWVEKCCLTWADKSTAIRGVISAHCGS